MEALTVISKNARDSKEPKVYSLWEYLALEERSNVKHEFYDGKIVKRANAKYNHNLIAANMLHFLRIELYKNEKNISF